MLDRLLDAEEARCLGSLIEKAMTTPDHYPMSLNGVVTACNQVSNRDPVVEYDDGTVERALRRMADEGVAKLVHRPGDRVVKYRHAADDVWEWSPKETALMAVLLLRGSQTPGELRQRTTRYIEFGSLPEVEITLDGLADRGQVERLERRPGQKEHRYRQLLTDEGPVAETGSGVRDDVPEPEVAASSAPDEVAALRAELAALEARFERLLDALGVDEI